MVISASRRTDIPAFFSRWFMNRLEAGFVEVVNPVNPSQVKRVDLRPQSVDAIVFWTRNPLPLLKYLKRIGSMGHNYYFLYTLTGYPGELEPNLPTVDNAATTSRMLSDIVGPSKVIWRYDPIILSSLTEYDYHRANFEMLCKRLSGTTNRAMVSFLEFYRKTDRRLQQLSRQVGIEWRDARQDSHRSLELMKSLNQIARSYGIDMQSCSEELDIGPAGVSPARCVDYELIHRISGATLAYKKDPSQRNKCLCGISVDIGAYNTCGYRCIYCYANSSFELSRRNFRAINMNANSLNPTRAESNEEKKTTETQTAYTASGKI
jgi:hypothetical protein